MKIIDHTSYFNENGEISSLDRFKAIVKFGNGWLKDIEAQEPVIDVLKKQLDKNYTLLRNVTPPGIGTSIPFILVGPTGVIVMDVMNSTGMFRAKGDQWGTISGSTFKPGKPNLLTRTERMARAVQVYLQRQGYSDLQSVESILLCVNPSVHVDSIRPIIRIVMRDALERFAVSIAQSRVVLNAESVQEVINNILADPKATPQPAETAAFSTDSEQAVDPYVPDFAMPGSEPAAFVETDTVGTVQPQVTKRKGINRKQWIFLIGCFVFWCLLMAVFVFLVVKDLYL